MPEPVIIQILTQSTGSIEILNQNSDSITLGSIGAVNYLTANQASGFYYPLSGNPSGYSSLSVSGTDLGGRLILTGIGGLVIGLSGDNIITFSGGAGGGTADLYGYLTTGSADIRYITISGNQLITGVKSFANYLSGISGDCSYDLKQGVFFRNLKPVIDFSNCYLNSIYGSGMVDWQQGQLLNGVGKLCFSWPGYTLYDHNENTSLMLAQRRGYDSNIIQSIDWESRILSSEVGGGVPSLNWSGRKLFNSFDSAEIISLDWSGCILSGDWTTNTQPTESGHLINKYNLDLSGIALFNLITGTSGVLSSQISNILVSTGSLTGLFISRTETGQFVSIYNTDIVYRTGNQIIYGEKTFDNTFINAKQIYGVGTNSYIDFQNSFLYANGTAINWDSRLLTTSNGIYSLDWENGYLYRPADNSLCLDWGNSYLYNTNGYITIDWGNGLAYGPIDTNFSINWSDRTLSSSAGSTTVDWGNRALFDSNSSDSISWENRILSTRGLGDALDWQNRTLSGDWITNTVPTLDSHITNKLYVDALNSATSGLAYSRTLGTSGYLPVFNSTGLENSNLILESDNILAQRRGTSPQIFRVYNSTGTNSGEYAQFGWDSGRLFIGARQSQSGILRDTYITGNSINLTSTVYGKNYYWSSSNNMGLTFTDTAGLVSNSPVAIGIGVNNVSYAPYVFSPNKLLLSNFVVFGWSNQNLPHVTDVGLSRFGQKILCVGNGDYQNTDGSLYISGLRVNTITGATNIVLSPSGNVGIGTTSPVCKLDVSGNIQASGFRGTGITIKTDGSSNQLDIGRSPLDINYYRIGKPAGGNGGYIDFNNNGLNFSNILFLSATSSTINKITFGATPNAAHISNTSNVRAIFNAGQGNSNPAGGNLGGDVYIQGGDSNNSDAGIKAGNVFINGGFASDSSHLTWGHVFFQPDGNGNVAIGYTGYNIPVKLDVSGNIQGSGINLFGNSGTVLKITSNQISGAGIVNYRPEPTVNIGINWSGSGVLFTGININFNNSGALSGSTYLNIQENGQPLLKIDDQGTYIPNLSMGSFTSINPGISTFSEMLIVSGSGLSGVEQSLSFNSNGTSIAKIYTEFDGTSGTQNNAFIINQGLNLIPTGLDSPLFSFGSKTLYIYTGLNTATGVLPGADTCTGRTYYIKNIGNTLYVSGRNNDRIFSTTRSLSLTVNSGESYMVSNVGNMGGGLWVVM